MNPKELKNTYPKTWSKFKSFCKEQLSKEKLLGQMAAVGPEKEDDMALLMIAVAPAVLTEFFDQSGKYPCIDRVSNGFLGLIKDGQGATLSIVQFKSTRKESEISCYEECFKLMENEN